MPRTGLPRLVATDLDGTLVRGDDTVSAFTHAVLDRVRAAGIAVVGATGRGPRLAELTRNDIRSADYLVMAGGGWVVDQSRPGRARMLHEVRLPGSVLHDVITDLEARVGAMTVMVEALDTPGAALWGDYDPVWRYPERFESRTRLDCVAGDVIKAFFRSPAYDVDDFLAIARAVVGDRATLTQAGLGFVEVSPPRVDKASGLAVVAAAVGVEPEDVLVFGDMPNDLPMFHWAGWGKVAVANAHPDLHAAATDVTLSNNDNGVAVYLDRLLRRAERLQPRAA